MDQATAESVLQVLQPFTTSQPAEELAARRAKLSGPPNRLLGELAWSVPKTLGKHAELLRQTSGSLAVKREQASPGDDTKPAAVQNDPGGCPAVDERCPASDDPNYCEDRKLVFWLHILLTLSRPGVLRKSRFLEIVPRFSSSIEWTGGPWCTHL